MKKLFILFFLPLPFIIYALPDDTINISLRFGNFVDAESISISRGEFIFVSDLGSNKIYKYNSEGLLIASYGGTGLGKNELNQPVSIDASNGLDVFVCDYLNNRIVRLDDKLNLISSFDFDYYNTGVGSSKKIYNPRSITSISTGELLLLCEAGNYKALRIREFSDINLYFGQSYDRILDPKKIVKGNTLDVWVFEKSSSELLNFNNLGIFVRNVKLPETFRPISVTYAEQYLVILAENMVIYYDLVKGAYTSAYYLPRITGLKDLVMAEKETIFVLQKHEVLKFEIK